MAVRINRAKKKLASGHVGTSENILGKSISQIVTGLFENPTGSKELSAQIQRLGLEIRLFFQSEETVFGKLRGLFESLREIIPDEQQRYHAAFTALCTTSKESRQNISKALIGQIEELNNVEKRVLLPALPGWRDELKIMEAKSLELRGELSKLRERLGQLEREEKAVLSTKVAREKDLDQLEENIREFIENVIVEITADHKKVEELPGETAPARALTMEAHPVSAPVAAKAVLETPPATNETSDHKKVDDLWDGSQIVVSSANEKVHRKCPMCGGPFNLLELENLWQCFSCAYEEPAAVEFQEAGEEPGSEARPQAPKKELDPTPILIEPLASMVNEPEEPTKGRARHGSQLSSKRKSCPVCFKKMVWHPGERVWRCPSGHHERKGGSRPGSRW